MNRLFFLVTASVLLASSAMAEPSYKCIFNHELLIVCDQKTNSTAHIQSFINMLKDTDVDAVMCCPTMWRANLFPSDVDPTWKKYNPDQPLSKFPAWDHIMRYLHSGGDPVKDTLEACRTYKKAFFISYRMNDHHYITDLSWPTHNAIWREHPEYWLGDSDTGPNAKKDRSRLFNYMLPPVREYYFSIIQELCTKYDVDGVELDFERFPKFFLNKDLDQGTVVMTEFVKRIREMLDRIGHERGKSLKLCVRVPGQLSACRTAGLDVPGCDAAGLVDMINISSSYIHTMEMDIAGFRAKTKHAKLYGEMNYVTHQDAGKKSARRYTTLEIYRATALNFFARGVDGLSLFNYDYAPKSQRLTMNEGLKRITDVDFLKNQAKDYVIDSGFGTFPATDEKTFHVVIPDNTATGQFTRAVLRIETKDACANLHITASFNGKDLEPVQHDDTELFPPLAQNEAYPTRDALKFYEVPLALLVSGRNEIAIRNLDKKTAPCKFLSIEIALYR